MSKNQSVKVQHQICYEGHNLIMRFHQPQKLESHFSGVSEKRNLARSNKDQYATVVCYFFMSNRDAHTWEGCKCLC